MCLTIEICKHKPDRYYRGFYNCEITKTSMRVYKIFDLNTCGHLQTPYMRKRLFLKDLLNGLQVQKQKFLERAVDTIKYGIHAYTSYNQALWAAQSMLGIYMPILVQMYIPKGTKIWYGTHYDIVAQKICFRTCDQRRFKNIV